MGCQTVKTIKGHKYLYYSYYSNGKKIQEYCGLDGTLNARKKVLACTFKDLYVQKKDLSNEMRHIKVEMAKLQ